MGKRMNAEMSQETDASMSDGALTVGQSDGVTDKTTSHPTKLHKPQQVIGYSHSTKPASEQVAGYLQQAIAHHQAGRLQEAGELYRDILQAQPNHPGANHNMGVLAVQMKQPAAGLPYFVAALNADPARRQYWLNYIDALLQAGQLEDARQVLALARQHGLEGDEVEALAARLEDGVQIAAQPNAESQQAPKESPPVSSAVPPNSKKTPKTKPIKPGKSARKLAPHQGRNPSPQETNTLAALFNEGRLTEAADLAQTMTVRFPQHGFGWKALGEIFKKMGRIADALEPMQKAAALSPGDVAAHYNLGNTLKALGRLDEAEASYRQALQIKPEFAMAHSNLGNVLKDMERLDEAEASYRRAIQINPDYADAHYNLGNTLKDMGLLDEAEASYRRALQIKPDLVEAHSNLGNILKDLGRLNEAEASYRRALQINPDYAEAHNNLGVTLKALDRLDEAEASYHLALQINPDYAEAHNNLGVTLKALDRLNEAEASYRQALQITPDYAEAHSNLGATLQELGCLDEAEASYRRVLQITPDYAEAHYNLGLILHDVRRLDEAEASYRRVLQITPDYAEAYSNLGNILMDLGRLNEAEASYRRALQLKPEFAVAHNNLGNILKDLGRLDEAEASLRRALQLDPDYEDAFGNLLFTLNYHPDKSGEEIFGVYREYDARFGLPHQSEWRPHGNSRDTKRRLKVGYVSPDFKKHSVRHFLESLLAHHDKQAVEVYAYAELAREDEVTARYKNYVDQWIPTRGLSDKELAERIRADGIDILVELAGHTTKNRLGVFARKPAPVSLSWLGYGYSTGLTAIDYFLTDEVVAPAGCEGLFSEKPWRLAMPALSYRPAEDMGELNPLPAMSAGYVTFGTLSRGIRINHRVIRVWSEILKCVEGARLVIDSADFRDEYTRDMLAKKFAAHGIGRDRLQIGCHSPPWDVLRGMDIGLDCFPHNSGTTLFETLYMGVPYITLAARPSVGRLGSSILQGTGHPEWIAKTENEYVEKAVDLANDLGRLAAQRAALRTEMEKSPLLDEVGFARKVEDAYRGMWEIWCAKGDKT
jgi:protein O-GlcNAc transferase